MTALSSDEIRRLVREALKEAWPERGREAKPAERNVSIRIESDDDLNRFAREIAKADEATRARIAAGQLRYTLQHSNGAAPAKSGALRLDKGVLTEAMVAEIGRSHERVIIGKGVAVTPLARDRARQVKLEIVRDKP